MAEVSQFGSTNPAGSYGRGCLPFESMLVDSMDGTLSPEDQARFDAHLSTCGSCSEMLANARRGAAWLDLLQPYPPEPPADLVSRILQQTSVQAALDAEAARRVAQELRESNALLGVPTGISGTPLPTAAPALPASGPARLLPFPSRFVANVRPALGAVLQTRFAMTAAMAFFSVALTLNLTGVQLSQLHARDLRPSNVKRGFYEANARVVRYYESFRVVYELESRVRDLQHTSQDDAPATDPAPASGNDPQPAPQGASTPGQQTSPAPVQKAPASPQHNPPQSSTPAAGDRSGHDDRQAGSVPDPHHKQPAVRGLGTPLQALDVRWSLQAMRHDAHRGGKGVLA